MIYPETPGATSRASTIKPLVLHDVVRIVWASRRPHTEANIGPFASVTENKGFTSPLLVQRQQLAL